MKYIQYDESGNILFVTKGVRQPVFFGQLIVDDSVETDGMMIDLTSNPPILLKSS